VEHGRGVRPTIGRCLFLASCLIDFRLAVASDERHHFDAVLATLDRSTQGLPSVEREDVLSRLDIGFGNSLPAKIAG
jgi:hypothetical protein